MAPSKSPHETRSEFAYPTLRETDALFYQPRIYYTDRRNCALQDPRTKNGSPSGKRPDLHYLHKNSHEKAGRLQVSDPDTHPLSSMIPARLCTTFSKLYILCIGSRL
ncbi:hypothetical protein TGRUB_431710 [Toxoplasma gondii RUB]|uniref:Uncharacterized protein n=1 Tax=Toxoplasma gondii RUB TaxID=935652 RepID=A0A086LWB0_TOXGO|nr:hypothetical protein TGRUB_431710 [Toxoplasma gondii RUB]